MQLPSVVHPKLVEIKGAYFEVISHAPLTDEQARQVALNYFRNISPSKLTKGAVFQVRAPIDPNY